MIPALLLALSTAIALPLMRTPAEADAVAVYLGPGIELREAVGLAAAAGGRVIRPTGLSGLYVLRPDGDAADGFHGRLKAGGAWLLIDPLVAGGCGSA